MEWLEYGRKWLLYAKKYGKKIEWQKVSGFRYLDITLVYEYPEWEWDFYQLSRHPQQFDFDFIIHHVEKDWDWRWICQHYSIHLLLDFCMKSSSLPKIPSQRLWHFLYKNRNLTPELFFDTILPHLYKQTWFHTCETWHFRPLFSHPMFTWNDYNRQPLFQYCHLHIRELCHHPQFNPDWIQKFPVHIWDWYLLSNYVPLSYILQTFDQFPWKKEAMMCHAHLSISIVKKCIPITQWSPISFQIDCREIFRHPELPWKWKQVSMNDTLRPHHVAFYLNEIPWDWVILAKHLAFPPQIIYEHWPLLHKKWRWDISLIHPNITLSMYKYLKQKIHRHPRSIFLNIKYPYRIEFYAKRIAYWIYYKKQKHFFLACLKRLIVFSKLFPPCIFYENILLPYCS